MSGEEELLLDEGMKGEAFVIFSEVDDNVDAIFAPPPPPLPASVSVPVVVDVEQGEK